MIIVSYGNGCVVGFQTQLGMYLIEKTFQSIGYIHFFINNALFTLDSKLNYDYLLEIIIWRVYLHNLYSMLSGTGSDVPIVVSHLTAFIRKFFLV